MSDRGSPYRFATRPPVCGRCDARLLRRRDAFIDPSGDVVLCTACFERRLLLDAVRSASSAVRDERARALAGWSFAVLAGILCLAVWTR